MSTLDLMFPSIISVLGSCGAGKSYITKYIITENKKKFDDCIVFTSTGFTNSYNYLNELEIKPHILGLIDIDLKIKRIMKKQKNYHKKGIKSRLLVVFDDILGAMKTYSKMMLRLLSTFRQYNISIIFISQYAASTPTFIRELSYYNIVFNQETQNSMKACHESYFREFSTLGKFIEWFQNKLKEKYTFFFIDRLKKIKFIARAPSKI